ncbi:unnamed protein product [Durusdinium trenchii]|uniref:Uncharacterized protein n=1 Tax=Durusdinium trenchii TaxID=1381693 RepID=A0ABP0IS73_9DINO
MPSDMPSCLSGSFEALIFQDFKMPKRGGKRSLLQPTLLSGARGASPLADGLAMESTRPKHHLGIRCDAAAAWEREREQHSEAYFAAQLAQRRRIHAACFKLQRWWKQELLRRKLVYENMMDAMQLLRDLAAIKVQSWWRARQGLPPFTAPSAPGSPGAPLLAPEVERRALRVHGEAAHGGG